MAVIATYVDNVQCLLNGLLCVEGESGVDLGGDLARNDLQDLCTELNQEVVEGSVNLLVDVLAVVLSVLNGLVNQLGVFGLFRCGKDERWVGRGILRLVLFNGCEVTRVGDNGLFGSGIVSLSALHCLGLRRCLRCQRP